MCSGSKSEVTSVRGAMEGEVSNKDLVGTHQNSSSPLLELAATNDLIGFKHAVEEGGHDVDEAGLWYGRKLGSKMMCFVERTPLMVAAMFGSMDVLSYILQTSHVDVNRACGSDGATALHCVAAGGSLYSCEVIKLLIDSSADVHRVDVIGKRPSDVIAPCFNSSKLKRKTIELLLKNGGDNEEACLESEERQDVLSCKSSNDGNGLEKKEYPVDPSLPDIKTGVYGSDEFRMYTFKVKPCSRAYSHDWTECPFVHPGENARRRDPRKYHYSCVPCPEFRKGSCPKGDACEYAHGIFECWLHPAQYRTRICKDETNCSRRVCFFAHKREELRPLHPSTGSAVPSPTAYPSTPNSFDMALLSPLALSSPSVMMSSASTPPFTPPSVSSPKGGGGATWQNHLNVTPPTLYLPASRLKAALSARDMELEAELHRQHLLDEFAAISVPSPRWGRGNSFNGAPCFSPSGDRPGELGMLNNLKPTNLDEMFGNMDNSFMGRPNTQLQSPTGMQMRQNMNQSAYSSAYGMEPCGSPVSNPRLAAFAKRSQSFIDRSGVNRNVGRPSSPSAVSNAMMMSSRLSDWGSPDGKLDWGVQGNELNKLRKSASFGFQNNNTNGGGSPKTVKSDLNEPDVSSVQSLVKDAPTAESAKLSFKEQLKEQYRLNSGGSEGIPPWVEQFCMEQEPMVA